MRDPRSLAVGASHHHNTIFGFRIQSGWIYWNLYNFRSWFRIYLPKSVRLKEKKGFYFFIPFFFLNIYLCFSSCTLLWLKLNDTLSICIDCMRSMKLLVLFCIIFFLLFQMTFWVIPIKFLFLFLEGMHRIELFLLPRQNTRRFLVKNKEFSFLFIVFIHYSQSPRILFIPRLE